MEGYHNSPMNHVNNIFRKKGIKSKIQNIQCEYNLKRSIFNPNNLSPNIFMSKLEKRMGFYYSSLYNSLNSDIK